VGEENPIHDIATANASDDQGSQVSAQDSHDTDLLHPNISVAKQANVTTALVGDTITYTFTVTNPGDTPLSSVTVTDPRCDSGTLSGPSGDTSNTGKLDTTETWTYHCTQLVVASDSNPIHNVVTASGQDSLGGAAGTVTDSDQKDVSVLRPYTILGFFPPLPDATWKKGRTVPFKIALAMNGVRISDSEAAALLSPNCRVKISASGAFALAPTCMKYDSANDQFYFNMKLTKPGAETVTVTVSYPGTSSTTTKSIGPFTIF
jgi:uncharacterized repeat protein (TIGR01451 family)